MGWLYTRPTHAPCLTRAKANAPQMAWPIVSDCFRRESPELEDKRALLHRPNATTRQACKLEENPLRHR